MRALLFALPLLLTACVPAARAGTPFADVRARLNVAPQGGVLRVLVMGDQGTGTGVQRRVASAMAAVCADRGCDLGVGLGDNFYPAGPKEATSPLFRERFADLYGGLKVPFLMVSGNHDESWLVGGDGADAAGGEAQVAYGKLNPQWVMPARSYRAAVGDLAEFFVVATSPLASTLPATRPQERPGGAWALAQQAWLGKSLAQSGARWKLVLGHHPLYSNGSHGDAGSYDGAPTPGPRGDGVRALYARACGRADAVLSGHDHALEVFAPQPGCAGTWGVVSGAAGKTGDRGRGARPAAFERYGEPGFMRLELRQEAMRLEVYTVDEAGRPQLAHAAERRR